MTTKIGTITIKLLPNQVQYLWKIPTIYK